MKQVKFTVILGFASLLLFFACQKHLDTTPTPPTPPVTPPVTVVPPTETDVMITASIQGRVTDQSGSPVKDATVTSGTNSVQTDLNGIFRFAAIQTSKYFGYIKISKTGFFTGSRTIVTSTTGVNYVEVELLPRTGPGQFDAATGATITSTAGNSVTLPANSILTASSNATYSGTVNVYSSFIDPTDSKMNRHMPGDLRGTDTSGRTVGLQSFGIVAVELEGSAGEKLQLAPGKTATISFPIPAALQSAAPATIPLWYFNDTTGKWIEQGTATKNGSNYIGNVSHFTYWNCDWPSDIVYFTANIRDQTGNPLAYASLQITNTTTNGTQTIYSDSVGSLNGWVFKNTVLSFAVVDNCGTSLVTKSEGPFTANQDLGTISVTSNPDQMVTVHGTVVDCGNSPVANGYVSITLDGMNYGAAVVNGNYSATILKCSGNGSNLQIYGGDYTTQVLTDTIVMAVTGGDVSVGTLTACGVHFDQYFIYNIDGNTYTITDPSAIFSFTSSTRFPPGYTLISATAGVSGTPGYQYTSDFIPLTDTGTTQMYQLSLHIGSTFYAALAGIYPSVTVTRYDASGGYMQGSYSGNLYVDSVYGSPPHAMTGSFKVKVP
jgi:hypothetical protein